MRIPKTLLAVVVSITNYLIAIIAEDNTLKTDTNSVERSLNRPEMTKSKKKNDIDTKHSALS